MKKWAKMLAVGAISGAIQGASAYLAMGEGLNPRQLLTAVIVGAITGAALYAKQPPQE